MKLPQAWTKVAAHVGEQKPTPVTARVDMSAEVAGAGLCPDCKRPMGTGYANGHETYVCHADRISIPKPDVVEGGPLPTTFVPS
jgi:hypothetical protein